MKKSSRINNSLKNLIFGIGGQLLGIIVGFVSRTVFINILGAEYLGISGLFTNILTLLSLAELGVGSAIICSLYKPLAERDESRIKALMDLYATAYRVIACVVAVLGLMLVPFLKDIIKDKPDIPYLTVIYLMFLADSVVSYFFSYKNSIIIADQNRYIITVYEYGFNIAQLTIQIILLLIIKNYLLYLVVQVACSFLKNYFISRQADKMYPFLKTGTTQKLDKESRKGILKNIGAMMSHKIGAVVVFSTDNILISAFVGVYWVGLYSNYGMIVGIVNSFIGHFFSSINASVGDLTAQESREKAYSIFNTIFFVNFWMYSCCTISLWILLNPFITMWIGSKYILSQEIVFIIITNFFVTGMRRTILTFRDAMGLFWQDRYKPLFEAAINFIASILLVKEIGITGVFLGTLISTITTSFWVEPYILYKHGFEKPVRVHFAKYVMYIGITIIAAVITELACSMFTTYTFFSVVGRAFYCLFIPNVIFTILFFRTREFEHVYGIVRGLASSCLQLVKMKISRVDDIGSDN